MNLKTVSQFSKENPAFPQGGLRRLIFDAKKNGLKESGAIKRIGRKVVIDVELFSKWIDSQQEAA